MLTSGFFPWSSILNILTSGVFPWSTSVNILASGICPWSTSVSIITSGFFPWSTSVIYPEVYGDTLKQYLSSYFLSLLQAVDPSEFITQISTSSSRSEPVRFGFGIRGIAAVGRRQEEPFAVFL